MRYLARLILSLVITMSSIAVSAAPTQTAMFAGGCFWCMQPGFDKTPGVIETSVGYTGGAASTAHYDAVSTGTTGHIEAIQVTYDPTKVTYEKLLETYWENIDPTDPNGQFADKGSQYHTAIFYADEAQHAAARKSKEAIAKKFAPQPIVVQIRAATPFYAAEDYHQQYYLKNQRHYDAYKQGSGRAHYLQQTWGSEKAE